MSVLVVNAGSSSLKYALVEPRPTNQDEADDGGPDGVAGDRGAAEGTGPATVLARGVVERVGSEQASLRHSVAGTDHTSDVRAGDHTEAMAAVADAFERYGPPVREHL